MPRLAAEEDDLAHPGIVTHVGHGRVVRIGTHARSALPHGHDLDAGTLGLAGVPVRLSIGATDRREDLGADARLDRHTHAVPTDRVGRAGALFVALRRGLLTLNVTHAVEADARTVRGAGLRTLDIEGALGGGLAAGGCAARRLSARGNAAGRLTTGRGAARGLAAGGCAARRSAAGGCAARETAARAAPDAEVVLLAAAAAAAAPFAAALFTGVTGRQQAGAGERPRPAEHLRLRCVHFPSSPSRNGSNLVPANRHTVTNWS